MPIEPLTAPTAGLVSIVVCAYNNWPDLELAIESALCQSYRPIEVIVVDNSSSDGTEDGVRARFGERVRYVKQPNTGDSGAYNTGMTISRGEFVQFLDGDDILAPNKVERQVDVFRSDPEADVVYGNVRYFQSLPGPATWTDFDAREEDVGMDGLIRREGRCVGAVLGVLFRRRALDRVGKWDESIYVSDSDYEMRALLAGCRYRRCEGGPMSFKRVRHGQMGTDQVRMFDGQVALWQKALHLVDDPALRDAIRFNLARARFFRGFRAEALSRREALAQCFEGRRTSPRAVGLPMLIAGCAIILMPGGRTLARSARFRTLRRAVARTLRYPIPV